MRTIDVVEILFLVGALLVVLHFLGGLAALICTFERSFPVPSWIWTELKVFVYLVIPIMWFRLLSIVSTYQLRPNQKKQYIYIGIFSFIALMLAFNLSAWYSNGAFPLLSITYVVQWMLDARLSAKSRRQRKVHLTSHTTTPRSIKKRLSTKLKQRAFSQHEASDILRQRKQAEGNTPARLSQKVGIWHCHADEKFAARLRTHLQPKIRQGVIDLWDASQIQPGTLWQNERAQAIQSCAVAVVLVSADLMACDSIACDELPQLLYRAMTQGTVILLLHVSPCDIMNSGLERFHPLNSPEKPLAKMERSDREKVLTQATHIICQRLGICL